MALGCAGPAAAAPHQSSPPAHIGLGIRLLEAPAALAHDPRAQRYVVDHVRPGTTFTRTFEVTDDTGSAAHVLLYANAAVIQRDQFLPLGRSATNEITEWVRVTPPSLDLQQGQRATGTIRVSVPTGAPTGEYYGVVFAELPGTGAVAVNNRVGIRVYLDVGPGGAPKSDFAVDSLQAVRRADGSPAVLAQVHNTGARALDMRGTLQLSRGPGGLSAGPFPAQLGTTLAPGDTEPVVVPLDKAIRGGPWHAVIDLKSGLLERKAEGDITFPDAASSQNAPVRATAVPLYKDRNVVSLFAATLIGIIALLLLLLALFGFLRRRRREQDAPGR